MLSYKELDQIEELDRFVARFESAYARDSAVGVADFIPAREHPLYGDVLRELLRVDLEYGWTKGQKKSLEDYARQFPDFFEKPANVEALAFEEYRLRMQHGEEAS